MRSLLFQDDTICATSAAQLLEAGVVAGKLESEEKGRDRSFDVLVNRRGLWTKLE